MKSDVSSLNEVLKQKEDNERDLMETLDSLKVEVEKGKAEVR